MLAAYIAPSGAAKGTLALRPRRHTQMHNAQRNGDRANRFTRVKSCHSTVLERVALNLIQIECNPRQASRW